MQREAIFLEIIGGNRKLSEEISTRRMGYTRIYRSPGGARRLAMPEFDSGAIDKGSDGRDNRPLAKEGDRRGARGQRGAIRLCPEPTKERVKK